MEERPAGKMSYCALCYLIKVNPKCSHISVIKTSLRIVNGARSS